MIPSPPAANTANTATESRAATATHTSTATQAPYVAAATHAPHAFSVTTESRAATAAQTSTATQAFQAAALLFYESRCTCCAACAAACHADVHTIAAERRWHELDRARCTGCGACAAACPADALELRGTTMDVDSVMKIVRRDIPFYASSGGGLTISGGEPLYQFDFTRTLLAAACAEGIHTCLDTSGWGGRATELVALTNLFLWDIKDTDPLRHLVETGAELPPLLAALRAIDAAGGTIRLRCPLIPSVNATPEHLRRVAELANTLQGVVGIDLIAYHDLGIAKQAALGVPDTAQIRFSRLSDGERETLLSSLNEATNIPARWHI